MDLLFKGSVLVGEMQGGRAEVEVEAEVEGEANVYAWGEQQAVLGELFALGYACFFGGRLTRHLLNARRIAFQAIAAEGVDQARNSEGQLSAVVADGCSGSFV